MWVKFVAGGALAFDVHKFLQLETSLIWHSSKHMRISLKFAPDVAGIVGGISVTLFARYDITLISTTRAF